MSLLAVYQVYLDHIPTSVCHNLDRVCGVPHIEQFTHPRSRDNLSRSPHCRSNSTGLPIKVGSVMDRVFDALRKTTEGEHPPAPDVISSGSSAPSSEDNTAPSPLGIALPRSAFTPPAHDESILPTSTLGTSMQLALDELNSADVVRSTERRQSAFSLPEQPAPTFAKQPALHLAVGNTVPLSMAWERAAREIGDQLPATEEGAITLDQAIVWPSGSLTHTDLTTGTADEAQAYGGGAITGCNGDVVLGAGSIGE